MVENLVNNWPSLLFYLFAFLVSATFIYFGNKIKSSKRYVGIALVVLGLAIPVLVAGIRYDVGRDFRNYLGMVERAQVGEPIWPRAIEPLSSLVIHASAQIGGGGVAMFSIFATLTIVFAYFALKRLSPEGAVYTSISWFLYLCSIYPTTLNAVRSGLAVSIAAFAFSQIVNFRQNHRLIKFILWIAVASLFHMSAIVCLPIGLAVYFISRKDSISLISEKVILSLAIAVAIAFPLLGGLVATVPLEVVSNFARYFREAGDHFYITIVSAVTLLVILMTYLINKASVGSDFKLRILYSIVAYYVPIAIIIGWLSYYTGTSRLAFYLDMIVLVLLSYSFKAVASKKQTKQAGLVAILVVIFVFGVTMLVRNSNWASALPYETIFSQGQTDAYKN